MTQVECQRTPVDICMEGRMRLHSLEFRPKQEDVTGPAIIQGFNPKPVTYQGQPVLTAVPQCEGEHSIETLHRLLNAPLTISSQDDFGIGMPPEGMSQNSEFISKLTEIIDFTIENDDITAISRKHGLVAGRREVKDGETAESQCNPTLSIRPVAAVVRTAVADGFHHA